jgi:hypothetical protein
MAVVSLHITIQAIPSKNVTAPFEIAPLGLLFLNFVTLFVSLHNLFLE